MFKVVIKILRLHVLIRVYIEPRTRKISKMKVKFIRRYIILFIYAVKISLKVAHLFGHL